MKDLDHFDIEVSDGLSWVSLEEEPFTVGSESLSEVSASRNYESASSPIYDGEWIVHASLGNASETIRIYIASDEQREVDYAIEKIVQLFDQHNYRVRVTRGNSVETWVCFPAEYSIDRSHVMSHNTRAVVNVSIPRLPRVIRETR